MPELGSADSKYYGVLFSLFLALFLVQFVFRQFLQPILPFTPAPTGPLTIMGLVGTFGVAALAVVTPALIYETRVPLRPLYFTVTVIALWGGVALSFFYPHYYYSWPWLILSVVLWGLTILAVVMALTSMRPMELALMMPIVVLQFISLVIYILNIVTEYYLTPLEGVVTQLAYPMLLLTLIGALTLTILASMGIRASKWGLLGYAISALTAVALAMPLYSLTINNRFMQSIMDMIFAMGFGILAPPTSVPLLAIFLGLYVFSSLALIVNGVVNSRRYLYLAAIAVTYVSTAYVPHVLSIYFTSVMASSLSLAYTGVYRPSR